MKKTIKNYRVKSNIQKLILSIVLCLLIGMFGSIFTSSSVSTWYTTLIKPAFNPPSWLFGPVWTALYILMGISFYLIWKTKETKQRNEALDWFLIQLGLNFLWSLIFFGMKMPGIAFIEILLLETTIIITALKFYKISKSSAYLMIPYILWVGFATILNFAIFYLN